MSLIEVRLRPTGPWRPGDRAGDRERVDVIYHSDALYSAITLAMRALGWLEEWLDATARCSGEPAVRLSSLFPFIGKTRLVAPPKTVWPPTAASKLYLQGAKLIPLEILKSGVVEESRWQVDGESECMLPMGVSAPFQVSMRFAAAVDRITGATDPHRTACLEFASNAGWWGVFEVSDPAWEARVKSAIRLLADSGFGGERSRGWGRASEPAFSDASHLFASVGTPGLWWLLSLYSPHTADTIDWSRGEYSAVVRGGWTDSLAGTGPKKQVRMIAEGSVLASDLLRGQAVDVAPEGFAHPVYRAGFALAMPAPGEIAVRAVEAPRPPRPVPVVPATPEPVFESSEPITEEVRDEAPEIPEPIAEAQPLEEPTAASVDVAAAPGEELAVEEVKPEHAEEPAEPSVTAVEPASVVEEVLDSKSAEPVTGESAEPETTVSEPTAEEPPVIVAEPAPDAEPVADEPDSEPAKPDEVTE